MRAFKKIFAVLIAAVMMTFTAVPAVYADDDDAADVGAVDQQAQAVPDIIFAANNEYDLNAGSSNMISVPVKIRNNASFSYILATLSGGSSDIEYDERETRLETNEKGELSATFHIKVSSTAPSGKQNLNVNFTAYDGKNNVITVKTLVIKLNIISKLQLKGLVMDSYKVSKESIRPGDHFDIEVTLKNNTGMDVKNAEIAIDGLDTSKFVLDKGFSKQYIDISRGKTGTVKFSLIAQDGITLVRESISLVLSYTLDENKSGLSSQSTMQVVLNCVPNEGSAKYGAHDISMTNYIVSSNEVDKGTKFDLTVELKNNGSDDIVNARVAINPDVSKFSIDTGLSYSDFSIKKGETKKFTFKLIGGSGIASEREPIPVSVEYGSQTVQFQAVVSCKGSGKNSGKYDLTVTDYSISVNSVTERTVFDLKFALTNSGVAGISHARVTVMNLDGSKFAIDSGLPYSDFDIKAGETKTFTFRLVGCKGLTSIREVIPIQIDYGDISNTYNVTVKCVPKDSSGTDGDGKKVFAPNIIIESYDFGGEFVTAGKIFPLNVQIKNVSAQAVIENLKVTVNGKPLQDGSIAYSPANSSNSFFFDTLPCKGTQTISLDLLPKADSVPNSYPVEIDFTYEYSVNGERYQATGIAETLTIPLRQEDRLVINEPELPSWGVGVGEMCTINVSLVNKGKSAVYNVSATVEGDGFSVETPTYYIGNINSGSEEYYDAKITPMEEGEISGTIVFTYEDANNESKESRISFNFMAQSMMYDPGINGIGGMDMSMDDMPAEEDSGMPWWVWLIIGGGAGIVIIVVIVIIVKHNKKKAELIDDDEDN